MPARCGGGDGGNGGISSSPPISVEVVELMGEYGVIGFTLSAESDPKNLQ